MKPYEKQLISNIAQFSVKNKISINKVREFIKDFAFDIIESGENKYSTKSSYVYGEKS